MNYFKILLSFLLVAALCNSCKKKGIIAPVLPSIDKVKTEEVTMAYTTFSVTTEYFYDARGRLIKTTNSTGEIVTMDWSPGKCVEKQFSGGTSLDRTMTYNLNSSGYVSDYTFGDFFASYEYNSDGYMVKFLNAIQTMSVSTIYTIDNGNTVFSTYDSANGGYVYEYYADKRNTIGNENHGLKIFGKQDKNLRKRQSGKSSQGILTPQTEYTYEYDAKGRVSKKIEESQAVPQTTTKYTYYE